MIKEKLTLTEDGRVYLTCYLHKAKKRPAIIVCPGGAYLISSQKEGEPVALAYYEEGFNTFVLHYSLGIFAEFPAPAMDLAIALVEIRKRAEQWHIEMDKLAVCGFSAGGHIAATLGTMWDKLLGSKPNALVLGYPCILNDDKGMPELFKMISAGGRVNIPSLDEGVSALTPPAFIFHTYSDPLVPVEHSLRFASAMAAHDRPFELHLYKDGGHALSLADERCSGGNPEEEDESLASWFGLSVIWLKRLFGMEIARQTASSRAHVGVPSEIDFMPVTRLAETGGFKMSTKLEDVFENPEAMDIINEFMPQAAAHQHLKLFGRYSVMTLALAVNLASDKASEMSKRLKSIIVKNV